MAKKKVIKYESLVKVRIIGPDCQEGDRLYKPGETANIPAALAVEWINTQRAVETTTAEVKKWQPEEL